MEFENELFDTKNKDLNFLMNNVYDSIRMDKIKKFSKDQENELDLDQCLNCDSFNIYSNDGYMTCKDCGCRNSIIVDSQQEWRYYGADDSKNNDPARCGIPTNELLPNSSIGSVIYNQMNNSYSNQRIMKIHSWNTTNYEDTSLLNSFNNIQVIASNAGINPCIIQEAKHMFKEVFTYKSIKRFKKKIIEAASVQWACKIKGVPRDSAEMALIWGITIKEMRKGIKNFEELWNAILLSKNRNKNIEDDSKQIFKPSDSLDYLHRICSKLSLPNNIYEICTIICNYVEEINYLIKHIPLSRTAGCLFFTCNIMNVRISKSDIANVCEVSEVTINKCFQKLLKIKDKLLALF